MKEDNQARKSLARDIGIVSLFFSLPVLSRELGWVYGVMPLPVFYYLILYGRQKGNRIVFGSLLVASAIAAIIGRIDAILFSLTLIPIGYILAGSVQNNEPPLYAGLKSCIALALTWIFFLGIIALFKGVNIYQELLLALTQSVDELIIMYKDANEIPLSVRNELEPLQEQLKQFMTEIFPALLCITVISTVWLNLVTGNWYINKKYPGKTTWKKYAEWALPDVLVWGVILCAAGLILPSTSINMFSMNVALVLGLLYFFQGLAILSNMLAKWSVPVTLKFVIFFVIVIQVYGMMLLAVLGIADTWADFRKIRRTVSENQPDQ